MDDDSQQFNDYNVYCKLISGGFFVLLDIIDNFNNIFILEGKKKRYFFFFEN